MECRSCHLHSYLRLRLVLDQIAGPFTFSSALAAILFYSFIFSERKSTSRGLTTYKIFSHCSCNLSCLKQVVYQRANETNTQCWYLDVGSKPECSSSSNVFSSSHTRLSGCCLDGAQALVCLIVLVLMTVCQVYWALKNAHVVLWMYKIS